jgi:hypothetical protein
MPWSCHPDHHTATGAETINSPPRSAISHRLPKRRNQKYVASSAVRNGSHQYAARALAGGSRRNGILNGEKMAWPIEGLGS